MSSNLIVQLKTPLKRNDAPDVNYLAGKMYRNEEGKFIVFNLQLPGIENPISSVLKDEDCGIVSIVNDDVDLTAALAGNDNFLCTVE